MKTLLACLLALVCHPGRAENTVALASVDGHPVPAPLLSGVSGQSVELSFSSGLAKGGQLEAFLTSGQLAAAVSSSAVSELGRVTVPMPEVTRPSELALVLSSSEAGVRRSLGQWRLTIYPKTLTADLKALLAKLERDSGMTVGVFGPAVTLREFLQTRGISFSDLGSEPPRSHRAGLLLVGELPAAEEAAFTGSLSKGTPALLFSPDSARLPGVYARQRLLTVTLPLLSELPTSPRAQFTLLQMLEQITKP